MQYTFPQRQQGYPYFRGEFSHPPNPPTGYYNNHGYALVDFPSKTNSNFYYKPFPGYFINVGNNHHDGYGIQKNGDIKLGNRNDVNKFNNANVKHKSRKTTIIGGCHGNQGGHQVSGDVILSDIK
ncbi:hypothetical protein BVRB_9g216280 [Beta vulgaris subsp. vulgaris]|nr:hypothetical protein BVRB_9g216280 [Beta vulgaris subsp. vulgaris]